MTKASDVSCEPFCSSSDGQSAFTWTSFLLGGDGEARHLDDGGAAAPADRQRRAGVALRVRRLGDGETLPQAGRTGDTTENKTSQQI